MLYTHSLAYILIGAALWSSLGRCSSNQIYVSDNYSFEHEGFTFHADSVTYAGETISIAQLGDDPVGSTWSLLKFIAGDNVDTDTDERIAALRREMRGGAIARDYSWPMKDRSAKWIIEAYQMYRTGGDRNWLVTAFNAAIAALDAQWNANYVPDVGLLRGETDITGLNEPVYPQWMRLPDKLSSIHLSTNAITVTALKAVAAMADSLNVPSERFSDRANTLSRAINRHMWEPRTGTYARSLYSAPYLITCNTVDIPSLLLTLTSGSIYPEVARYMLTQLSGHGPELMEAVPQPPSLRWTSATKAVIGDHEHTLWVYENGLHEHTVSDTQSQLDISTAHRFGMINVVAVSSKGTTGYSGRPHKIIPQGTVIEIEAEAVGVSGTSLIRQRSMAQRFIELTPTKNSHIGFMVDSDGLHRYLMELLYTDGTSYQPWQLRSVIVNGSPSGIIAMPKLYTGPSTRGTSTSLPVTLNEGSNYVVIDTTPLLNPRGSILLDKIRLIRLD